MKNLSEVLNEVMTDIFTENNVVPLADLPRNKPMLSPSEQAAIIAKRQAEVRGGMTNAGELRQAEAKAAEEAAADELHQKGLLQQQTAPTADAVYAGADAVQTPSSYLEQLKQGASNLGSTIAQGATDAGNYLAQKGQEAAAAYQSMPGYLQYGIPAAALAAGAGALYLRKKQKAANKAAGIR